MWCLGVFLFVFVVFVNGNDFVMQERIISRSRCSLDRDCNENSFCWGNDDVNEGYCRCKEGFVMFMNRTFYECLTPAETVGSPCIRNSQCTLILGTHSVCQDGSCQCQETAHFIQSQNQCYRTSRPGELCTVDFNCLLPGNKLGNCYTGRCKCDILHHHTPDGRCVRSANLGDICTEDVACRDPFAACYDVCRCIGGYAQSSNGTCLVAATEFGANCTEISQCTEYLSGSFCQEGTCECHQGFHGIGPRCWRDVTAGGMCTDRRECFIRNNTMENVGCIDGVCTCLEGFENRRGHCLSGASTMKIFPLLLILISYPLTRL